MLGPHTDDGEWGCGASMAKWIRCGCDVFYVAFSAAEESVPSGFSRDVLRLEIQRAAAALGLNQERVQVLNYAVRFFPRDRQSILERMIEYRAQFDPDMVVVPSSFDTHQDHEVISNEAFRAFKRATILGYEMPWNNRRVDLTFFNSVSEVDVDLKVQALSKYKSQESRVPEYDRLVRALAVQRGWQIGVSMAEAFEVIRWVEH